MCIILWGQVRVFHTSICLFSPCYCPRSVDFTQGDNGWFRTICQASDQHVPLERKVKATVEVWGHFHGLSDTTRHVTTSQAILLLIPKPATNFRPLIKQLIRVTPVNLSSVQCI